MSPIFLFLTTICSFNLLLAQGADEDFSSSILSNGIQVYLKPLKLDDDSISIELAVKNGYASFKEIPASAYEISPRTVIESNSTTLFGGHDDSIDLYYSIEPFYSYWILETEVFHSKLALEGLYNLITHPSWTEKGFQTSLATFNTTEDRDDADRRALFQLNGIPQAMLSSELSMSVKKISLQDAEKAYNNLFSDPEKLIIVVSGSFKLENMQKLINESFGAMPRLPKTIETTEWPLPPFPAQPKEFLEVALTSDDPLVTLSFPIPYALNENTFPLSELLAQALEDSLKLDTTLKLLNPTSINISLELPMYPHLNSPWLLIQFQSGNKIFRQEAAKVAQAAEERFSKGVNSAALASAREQIDISDSFWKNEPEYWLAFLGNQSLMGFSPEKMLKKRKDLLTIPLEEVNRQLALFPQNQYTTFISSGKD